MEQPLAEFQYWLLTYCDVYLSNQLHFLDNSFEQRYPNNIFVFYNCFSSLGFTDILQLKPLKIIPKIDNHGIEMCW